MTREMRLRERIDQLADERDQLRVEVRRLRADLAYAVLSAGAENANQWGACPKKYETEEERLEARRRTWRESKRRKAAA